MSFSVDQIPDLSNKVAIVTGANAGIGKVIATELAKKGVHLIMACRSEERTLPVIAEIKRASNNSRVEFMPLDTSSLASVERFVTEFKSRQLPLHLLINNAGAAFTTYAVNSEGNESHFATNYLGHFLLTNRLLDVLESSGPSRVVTVASRAYKYVGDCERFVGEQVNDQSTFSTLGAFKTYGLSKLFQIVFIRTLAQKLEGKQIFVNCCHPGFVSTEIARDVPWFVRPFVGLAMLFARSPAQGALPALYLATSPAVEKDNIRGAYFEPIANLTQPEGPLNNPQMADKLWALSAKLAKL